MPAQPMPHTRAAYPAEVRQHCRDHFAAAMARQRLAEAALRDAHASGEPLAVIKAQLELTAAQRHTQHWKAHVDTAEAVRRLEAAAEAH